ncbi:glucosaminidase domain-containing protein [Minwuia sp.]|uniref:glucosaminidase domain-containing protein n=1 Tax=Minwuia sp. TaxID=2493630 RepID=UPI003A8E4DAA
MSQRFQLVLLALFVLAATGFSAWRHYHPPESPALVDDLDDVGRPPAGWVPKHFLPAPIVKGREMAVAPKTPTLEKKQTFFDTLRPVIRQENGRIAELRAKLLLAHAADETPAWVADVARTYRIDWTGTEWDALLARVDIVPLTLMLAQAANESSWGQSRFARQGNNIFGMWCFRPGCGIIPARRAVGKTHEVAAYANVNASVRAYLHAINTVGAYASLRKLRAKMRLAGRRLDANRLAGGLTRYSERGQAYVREIRNMIRANRSLMLGVPKPG